MNRSFGYLSVAAMLLGAISASMAGAQSSYGDPRNAPQGDPRYSDPQTDPRYGDRAYSDVRGRGGASATFYADDRFSGRSVTLDHGVRRLGEIGMEDKISSIQVTSGRWLVCEDDDFRGRCVTIDRSIGHLNRIGMEDKISSVRPMRDNDRNDRGGYGRKSQ